MAMKVTKTSPLTGKSNSVIMDVTQEQIDLWKSGVLIQDAMPQLSLDEREFIISGYLPNEWDQLWRRSV